MELPPETQAGSNTIGCLVDGELWATSRLPGRPFTPSMDTYYIIDTDSTLLAIYAEGRKGLMSFLIINPQIGENKVSVGARFNLKPECEQFSKENLTSVYITKFDTKSRVVSGRFAFELPCEKNEGNVIRVTEGRFDMYLEGTFQ